MTTPAEHFSQLDQALKSERKRTAGLDAVIQWVVSGDDGGEWYVTARSGSGEVTEGRAEAPTTTIRATQETVGAIADGQLDGSDAFYSGQIQMEGAPVGAFLNQLFGT